MPHSHSFIYSSTTVLSYMCICICISPYSRFGHAELRLGRWLQHRQVGDRAALGVERRPADTRAGQGARRCGDEVTPPSTAPTRPQLRPQLRLLTPQLTLQLRPKDTPRLHLHYTPTRWANNRRPVGGEGESADGGGLLSPARSEGGARAEGSAERQVEQRAVMAAACRRVPKKKRVTPTCVTPTRRRALGELVPTTQVSLSHLGSPPPHRLQRNLTPHFSPPCISTRSFFFSCFDEQDAWLEEWRRRFGCWWIGLPGPTQAQLGSCLGALSLHLGSRLDVLLGRPPAALSAAEPQCRSWFDEGGLHSLELPEFPDVNRLLRFGIPPIPRLMPAWEELEVYSRGGTADAADRTADAADRTADKTDRAALVGVGAAGVLSFVLAAALFTSRVLTRRQPSKRASRGGGGRGGGEAQASRRDTAVSGKQGRLSRGA